MNCIAACFGVYFIYCLLCSFAPFQNNETPLYVASKSGYQAIVEILLGSGADVNIKSQFVSDFI